MLSPSSEHHPAVVAKQGDQPAKRWIGAQVDDHILALTDIQHIPAAVGMLQQAVQVHRNRPGIEFNPFRSQRFNPGGICSSAQEPAPRVDLNETSSEFPEG